MVVPESVQDFIDAEMSILLFDQQFKINELWGEEDRIKTLIAEIFGDPRLFRVVAPT